MSTISQSPAQKLWFEDFKPGNVAEYGPRVITREDIMSFAAEFDPQKPKNRAGRLVVPGRLTPESWEQLFGADVSAKQGEDE